MGRYKILCFISLTYILRGKKEAYTEVHTHNGANSLHLIMSANKAVKTTKSQLQSYQCYYR